MKNSMNDGSDDVREPFSRACMSDSIEAGLSSTLERLFTEELSKSTEEFPAELKSDLLKLHFIFIDGLWSESIILDTWAC
jgi:hypothetical protein